MLELEYIIRTVCEYFNLTEEQFHSKSRKREFVQARQIAMYFADKYTKKSLYVIGLYIGKKDHATVIYSVKTVKNLYQTNKKFRLWVNELRDQFLNFIEIESKAKISKKEIEDAIKEALLPVLMKLYLTQKKFEYEIN